MRPVLGGMVLTVCGPIKSFHIEQIGIGWVLGAVLAQSGRCTLAPAAASVAQRAPANFFSKLR